MEKHFFLLLRSAFKGLSVEEVDTDSVNRKRGREEDAGEDMADQGVDPGRDPTRVTSKPSFVSAPSASGLHASPSPTTTTLPTTDPAATTSTPITTPPTAETADGTAFTGMPAPAYPAYGVNPSTTALPEATTAREPTASSSGLLWYAAESQHHHPPPATGAYMAEFPGYAAYEPGYPMPAPGYATLSGLRRGPESCGGRSRGSRGSSNRSLTRSELRKALQEVTGDLVGDIIQEIRAKLEPLIPPQGSPTTLGASPNRLHANHLVSGLSHTLGGVKSLPMPTPAVVPRSPFVPRTAQPPYSHVANSTRAELDQLGLRALRVMVVVEPYGSSDLGGDPSDDEPPSLSSASPSDDDDTDDPDHPKDRKKKKK